ncbi:GGDEF domain-containing protein [Aquimixticola soesokkakensis]|nr:GGDEF domain-containing protein [Aquimixticola soesokkakensis]
MAVIISVCLLVATPLDLLAPMRSYFGVATLSPLTLLAVLSQALGIVLAPRFGRKHDHSWLLGSSVAAAIALARLAEIYVVPVEFISAPLNMLLHEEIRGVSAMGSNTAVSVLLIALSVLLRRRAPYLALWSVIIGISQPVIGLVGYSYGFAPLFGQMSIPSIGLLLLNGLAALTLFPRTALLRSIFNSAAHGRFARNQLLLSFVVLWILGFALRHAPVYISAQHAMAVMVSGMLLLLFFLISVSAQMTERAECTRRKLERELSQMLMRDPLTGAANRRAVDVFVQNALRRSRSGKRGLGNRPRGALGVMLIDLDHFKEVNDRFGHRTGDDVLSGVASVLRARIKRSDLLARWGGEEFLVLMPDVTGVDEVRDLAQTLRESVAAHVRISRTGAGGVAQSIQVTASFGCAIVGREEQDHAAAVRRADEALYAAKFRGRNCVVVEESVDAPQLATVTVQVG